MSLLKVDTIERSTGTNPDVIVNDNLDVLGVVKENGVSVLSAAIAAAAADATAKVAAIPWPYKNYIINGRFESWLEGTTGNLGTSSGFFADLHFRSTNPDGGTSHDLTATREAHTVGQVVVPNNPSYFGRITVNSVGTNNASSSDFLSFKVPEVQKLSGKTVSLSFYSASSIAGQDVSIIAVQKFGTSGSPSSAVTTFAQRETLSTGFTKHEIQITLPSISGKTLGTDEGTNFTEFRIALSYGATAAVAFGDGAGALVLPNTGAIDLSDIQLEIGSVVTSFDLRDQSADDAMIANSLRVTNPRIESNSMFASGVIRDGSNADGALILTPPLDRVPVVSFSGNFRVVKKGNVVIGTGAGSMSASRITTEGCQVTMGALGGGESAGESVLMTSETLSGQIKFDARL